MKLQNITTKGKLKHPEFRLAVDTKEDLELVREIYKRLYRPGEVFYAEEVIDLFNKYPDFIEINAHVRQKNLRE